MSIEKCVATGFSYGFHPLLIPTYSYVILYAFHIAPLFPMGTSYFVFLLFAFFIFTFLLPFALIYIMYKKKLISSLHLPNRKERHVPYLVVIACLWSCTWLFEKITPLEEVRFIVYNTFSLLVVASLINYRVKISAHMLGMGALTIYIYFIYSFQTSNLLFVLLGTIILSGLVAHARLFLKEHSFFEVILGYCLGILLTFAVYSLFQ